MEYLAALRYGMAWHGSALRFWASFLGLFTIPPLIRSDPREKAPAQTWDVTCNDDGWNVPVLKRFFSSQLRSHLMCSLDMQC